MVIYKISSSETPNVYIGQTIKQNPLHRWSDHKARLSRGNHSNIKLQRAWKKYGGSTFKFEIIETCSSIDELNSREIELIKEYDSIKHGFNFKEGGRNGTHSEETRKKLSRVNLGKHVGSKNNMYGKSHSVDTKKQISENRKGKGLTTLPNSTKAKISVANTGKKRTPEQRAKISEAVSGERHPFYGKTRPTHSALMMGDGNPRFGKKLTDETKAKISASQKLRHLQRKHGTD
jgi:group I intron endonuclease